LRGGRRFIPTIADTRSPCLEVASAHAREIGVAAHDIIANNRCDRRGIIGLQNLRGARRTEKVSRIQRTTICWQAFALEKAGIVARQRFHGALLLIGIKATVRRQSKAGVLR
jgi:hypothetical protein